jgi:hypothetical protein
MSLEKRIDFICEYMPDGWSVPIKLEEGSGFVVVVRPNGTEVNVDNGDNSLEEQLFDAYRLAQDEIAAEKLEEN